MTKYFFAKSICFVFDYITVLLIEHVVEAIGSRSFEGIEGFESFCDLSVPKGAVKSSGHFIGKDVRVSFSMV